jgi:Transposase
MDQQEKQSHRSAQFFGCAKSTTAPEQRWAPCRDPLYFVQLKLGAARRKDRTMKRSRLTEEQIIALLREQEAGVMTAEVRRKHGISTVTFYAWKGQVRRHE